MRRLRKFWTSPRQFKWLLVEAFLRLGVVWAFQLLPLPGRAYYLKDARVSRRPPRNATSSQEICRAVEIAARFNPGAACLAQARVGCAMLNRFGYPAEVKLGVSKNLSRLEAHAWVECGGAVVMGNSENRYVELPKMDSPAGDLELPRA